MKTSGIKSLINYENKKKLKDIEVKAEKAHADFGASGSKKWLNCPGSIKLSEGMPNYESKYAKEGTDAHACLEFILKNRKNIFKAATMANKTWPKEMCDHAYDTAKYVLELLEVPNSELFIETRVDSSAFTTKDQFSTLDIGVALYNARTLHIMDYKYGAGLAVDVVENSQLIYYALAMLLKLGHKEFDKVIMTIIQPRKEDADGEVIRSHMMVTEDLMEWGKKFKRGVKAALAPNAPLKAGDWCQFCTARIKCPALRDQSFKDAAIDFSPIKEEIKNLPAVKDVKDIGKVLQACEKLEVFIKAVKQRAYEDARAGKKVNGYKLVAQKTQRRWNDETKACEQAVKALGAKALTEPKLLSPAQFEKKFKKYPSAMKWMGKNLSTKAGGITLAKESDRRKATSIVDADFTVIGEDDAE